MVVTAAPEDETPVGARLAGRWFFQPAIAQHSWAPTLLFHAKISIQKFHFEIESVIQFLQGYFSGTD